MNRWNIEKIIFYSKDNRTKVLDFKINEVNIITGESHKGKSALVEVIDYLLGSSKCFIPGIIATKSVYVGILWTNLVNKLVICRKMSKTGAYGYRKIYIDSGNNIDFPQNVEEINKREIDKESAYLKVEQLFNIGDVFTHDFSNINDLKRISIRAICPFIFQDDNTVINKNKILWGLDTDRKNYFINSIPYFLSITDENYYHNISELKRLKKLSNLNEAKKVNNDVLLIDRENRARILLNEAKELGLISGNIFNFSFNEIKRLLISLTKWEPNRNLVFDDTKLNEMYDEEKKLLAERKILKNKIYASRKIINEVNNFKNISQKQKNRLISVNYFDISEDYCRCPICNNKISNGNEIIIKIKDSIQRFKKDIEEASTERPKLDSYITEMNGSISEIDLKLNQLRDHIKVLVNNSELIQKQLKLEQIQATLIGKITYFIEAIKFKEEAKDVTNLINRISNLEELVNNESIREKMQNCRIYLSTIASEILKKLPLDERYKNCPIDINLRDLSVSLIYRDQKINLRGIGSDENYLSVHMSTILAFHRYFKIKKSPVPGVIIFDQLSRPYFPAIEEEKIISEQNDSTNLLQYFSYLFDEVKNEEDLQIIILEHAYYKDNKNYKNATRYRWINEDGLIPDNWPE